MQPVSLQSVLKNIICQACPNGCHLSLYGENMDCIKITGNQCQKGVDYALPFLQAFAGPGSSACPGSFQPVQITEGRSPAPSRQILQDVATQWGLEIKALLPGLDIDGSPERSLFRTVFENAAGERYILEQIPPESLEAKTRMASTLAYLKQQGLNKIQPYLPGCQNRFLLKHAGQFWQITPFIPGTPLDRQRYLYEKWRGAKLADFLIALRDKSLALPFFDPRQFFSLPDYIRQLSQNILKYHPSLGLSLEPVLMFLEEKFFPVYDTFPVAFCHGDYHPLNIIWGETDIQAVIDWEFAGYKPEQYDTANLIGCIGIEHPSGLQGELVIEFIRRLQAARFLQDISWHYLVEFILAVRFAWLSEWLRKKDSDMIEMETVYMKLLVEEKSALKKAWL